MTLKEALQVGKRALGVIKCTYACVYDKSGERKLFSLQGLDTRWADGTPRTYAIIGKDRKQQYRAPIVIADRADNTNPEHDATVYFTEFAVDVIGEKYDKTTKLRKDSPVGNFAVIDKILEKGNPVVVRTAAIEWFPSDIVFTRDGEYADEELRKDYNERLEAARKKMEQAKAVLIGAGLSNLL